MKKFKFHWGVAIAIFYGVFALILMTKVIFSISQDYDLVAEDYYEQELRYQDQIEKMTNAKALIKPLEIIRSKGKVKIQFPDNLNAIEIKGDIVFYRSSDAQRDKKIAIAADEDFRQAIDVSGYQKGMWKLKIDWQANGIKYYNEADLYIR